jgi:cytochrome c
MRDLCERHGGRRRKSIFAPAAVTEDGFPHLRVGDLMAHRPFAAVCLLLVIACQPPARTRRAAPSPGTGGMPPTGGAAGSAGPIDARAPDAPVAGTADATGDAGATASPDAAVDRPAPPPDRPAGFPQDDPGFVPTSTSFERVKLAARLGRVTTIDVAPNEDVYFTERDGALKIWKGDGSVVTAGTLKVFTGNEAGFLGVILDPAFASNGWIYLLYSDPDVPEHHLSRFVVKDDQLVMSSEKLMLKIPEDRDSCCHVGGGLDFDGHGNLYIGLGDNSNPFESDGYAPLDTRRGRKIFDAQRTAGNSNDLRGKILRITPIPDGSYGIPAGNLFAGGGGRPEIYVMGNRNPFRVRVDRVHDWLYWGEVGPDACDGCDALTTRGPRGYDEFNQARSAGYYGWPYCIAENKPYVAFDFDSRSSGAAFDCSKPVNDSPNNTGAKTLPAARPSWISYSYGASKWGSGGRAALAGAIYQWQPGGSPMKLPRAYDGSVFLMDYSRGWIQRVSVDGQGTFKTMETWLPSLHWNGLISMRISPNGVMYVAEYGESGGAVYRVGFAGADRPPVAAASADVDSGPLPLSVRFSSMGSADPEMAPLTYSWDFDGDGKPDATEANPSHVYRQAGLFVAKLTVGDSSNTATATVEITAGNTRPVVAFTTPATGTFVGPGEKVDYSIAVKDAEEASASCATALVTPALGHDQHQHDGLPVTGCSGTITTASGLVPTENSWQLIDATFTDSGAPPAPRLTGKAAVLMHFKHLEAEHFQFIGASNDLKTEATSDPQGGDLDLAYINDGSWVCWDQMNFSHIDSVTYRVASAGLGGRIEIRRGGPTGPVISTAEVPVTGGWQTWTNVSAPLADPGGTARTCFVFHRNAGDQGLFNLNWIDLNGPGVSHR